MRLGFGLGLVNGEKAYQYGAEMHATATKGPFRTKSEWEILAKEPQDDIDACQKRSREIADAEDLTCGQHNEGNALTARNGAFKARIESLIHEEKEPALKQRSDIEKKG